MSLRLPLLMIPLLLLTSAALGQERPPPDQVPEPAPPELRYKAVTEIDADGVRVDGALEGPTIGYILEPRRAPFAPLLRLRSDFDDAMEDSVQQL